MNGTAESVRQMLSARYCRRFPGEVARLLEGMSATDALVALADQSPPEQALVWERLPLDRAEAMLATAEPPLWQSLIPRLDPVYAAALLRRAALELREQILGLLSASVREDLQRLMSYPEDTAGSLMDPRLVALREEMTVAEALERLRQGKPRFTQHLFIVDSDQHLHGMVTIGALALADGDTQVGVLARPVRLAVSVLTHRDELLEKLSRQGFSDVPVTDLDGRLVGVIHYDQLFGAVQEESSIDIQTMFGASRDERALSPVSFAVRKRLPWLEINLLTAFLAASVVGLFEDTIAQFTALAVLLPVVAGQSGNSGAQALAVTMRGLALREIGVRHIARVILKEVSTGVANGVVIALTTAVGVYLWSDSAGLSLVIGTAMVLSMAAAGLAGASIPIVLTAVGQDPAQSSSIILTTVTDVVGFFSFLGIATALSGML